MAAANGSDQYFQTDHLTSDLKRRTVRGAGFTGATQAVHFFLNLGSTVVLARLLAPRDFGLVAMVTALTGFVAFFRDIGLSTATVQKAEISHSQVSTLFWINVGLGVTLGLAVAALAVPISYFYREPKLTGITLVLAFGLPLGGFTVQHRALLQRQMRFGALAAIGITEGLANVLTGVTLALLGAGYWSLVFMPLAGAIAGAVGTWTACSWKPGLPVRNSNIGSMLWFGGNLTGFNVVNYWVSRFDLILLGRYSGGEALGFYGRAQGLLMTPLRQINAPLAAVATPALSRMTSAPERYRTAYISILEKILLVTMPGISLLIGTSDWVVWLILGPQWTETSRVFMAFGVAGLLLPTLNTTGWLFITQDRTHQLLRWGFVDAGIKTVCVLGGIPWGALGVATGHAVRVFIACPILLWFVGSQGPVRTRDIYRTMAPYAVCAVLNVVAIRLFRLAAPQSAALVGLLTCIGITVVLSLLFLVSLPSGRRALRDAYLSLLLLRRSSV